MSKKLINSVECCVRDNLKGFVAVNPGLRLLEDQNIITRHDINDVKASGKVTLVSGGGSGHEPGFAGYVGPGMLSVSVHGHVFTSPPSSAIHTAMWLAASGNEAGTLAMVMNYTGDCLNFGLAMEKLRMEGHKVDMIVIGEDCAFTSADKITGRRGLCGSILAMKIAGAMSEKGCSLEEIKNKLQEVLKNISTIGISLKSCTVPGGEASTFCLSHNELELGLGIHGEAGVSRIKMASAHDITKIMINHMINPDHAFHIKISEGDHIAVMINNLGGTSQLEMNIMAKEIIEYLEKLGCKVDRAYCGTFLTSLEMAGVSLTILKVDASIIEYLDAKTSVPAWPQVYLPEPNSIRITPKLATNPVEETKESFQNIDLGPALSDEYKDIFKESVIKACKAVVVVENYLNDLDREGGDGDTGSTMKIGAEAILKAIADNHISFSQPKLSFMRMANIAESTMGGSCGALYSIFLTSAASAFDEDCGVDTWCNGMDLGLKAVMQHGRGQPGDRSLVDALYAANIALKNKLTDSCSLKERLLVFRNAVEAAEKAAEATSNMKAKVGRATYVNPERLKSPDPGAYAVRIWLKAVYQLLNEKLM